MTQAERAKYTEYENNIAAGILPPGTDKYHGKK